MSIPITFNGVEYDVPEFRDTNYANELTQFFVAIPNGTLQPTGGTFTLLAETDFGASYGLKSLYYKSRGTNVSSAGILRMASAESIGWRNNAGDGNLLLTTNASDELLYNGSQVLTGAGPSSYVSSISGTANQVVASGATGAVTLSLPQSIATSSALQFGSLALGASLDSSSLLSMSSTTKGLLIPRMTTVQRDAIGTPATGLMIYNTTTNQYNSYDGGAWVALAMSGGGTVNAGTQYQLGYYAANGTTLSGLTAITASRALASDANGLPVAATTTATELGYVSGVTSAIQTQMNLKAPLASPTFTGTVTIPTPFTIGAISMTATATELNYVVGVTSAIQTQIDLKAPLASPTFSGTITTPLTASRALVTGASSELAASAVTATELGYVSGVTSAIQTQMNLKAPLASPTFTGTVTTAGIAMGATKITGLANGTVSTDAAAYGQVKILQVVQATTTTAFSSSSASFVDTNLSGSITPSSASSRVLVFVMGQCRNSTSNNTFFTILRGSTNLGDTTSGFGRCGNSSVNTFTGVTALQYVDSPATTSSTTYKVQIKTDGGTGTWGIDSGVPQVMILMEVQ